MKKILERLRRMKKYYLERGGWAFLKHIWAKLFGIDEANYKKWVRAHSLTEEELTQQRITEFEYRPLITIVIPLYKTQADYLKDLLDSIKAQTYSNWEICFSDGSGETSPLREILRKMELSEPRIKVAENRRELQISENTNAALAYAQGEYIAFADHDDLLAPDALFECVRAINDNRSIDMIYTDEDKVTMDGKEFFQPHFKSDFNEDLLCSMNYICHLLVVRKELQEQVGVLNPEYDGAQDYDFVLRCVEKANCIHHISKILYHWRAHRDSTAENPESKLYAFEAGLRAVQAHYERKGICAKVFHGEYYGLYRTKYILDEEPLVSIIIPNKDHIEDLDRCIHSIENKSTYKNYEIIIVENNSSDEETFDYYRGLEKKESTIKIVKWEKEFNYSSINNFGVSFSKGDYYFFLNNDTAIINDTCIEELLGYCAREDVGAVGARLYYEDGTIQHAGVIVGLGGIAGHAFLGEPGESNGYFSRILCAQNYSAVTAAALLVDKKIFHAVGGFNTNLAVAFNDIDLCMKIREQNKLIVYNPYAQLYHHESKSRGMEDTKDKVKRFNSEADLFEKLWSDILRNGDPYYNVNLTLEKHDFSLKV